MSQVPILCGGCKTPVEFPADADDHYEFVCTGCGRKDRLKDVVRTAQEYFVHRSGEQLSRSLAGSTRGNKFVKFEAKRAPHRSFRWITG